MTKEIIVKVQGCPSKRLEEFNDLQGSLKKLSKKDENKFRKELETDGFISPVIVWKEGNKIIDGHTRIKVLQGMLSDGYSIVHLGEAGLKNYLDEVPYVEISAKNEQEAARMVLAFNSQYGEITKEGFKDFTVNFDLDVVDLKDSINIGFNLEKIEYDQKPKAHLQHTCPSCGHQW